jgi:hypothetical protein
MMCGILHVSFVYELMSIIIWYVAVVENPVNVIMFTAA